MYYKTPTGLVLDENASHIKSILINNLKNCYLKFSNHLINEHGDDPDALFDEYDLGEIQSHVLELSDETKKNQIILGLIQSMGDNRLY